MGNEKKLALSRRDALKTVLAGTLAAGWKKTKLPVQSSSPARPGGAGTLLIDSHVAILVSPEEPGPVQKAARDLASDLAKVFGKAPKIIQQPDAAPSITIVIGQSTKLPEGMQPSGLTGPESFSISVSQAGWNRKRPVQMVVLSGADVRGTIYAVYHFAEEFLGVDPLYYWTDNEPARRPRIELPSDLKKIFPAPVFRYRGFFINDEDLLTGWAPDDKVGISLDVWDKVYETILRLKGNMVCPGTWIFPDAAQIRLAGERGIIVTQHHAILLGVNVARWPKGVPYNYTTHPEILDQAWKNAVAAYPPGVEVLWAVGLRGLSDVSYASMDPSVRNNDKALGRLIGKAISHQMQIVRSVHPDAQFVFHTWDEGARLVRQRDLIVPPEVHTVWADAGYGYLQDHGEVKSGDGAYYHVAMMNYRANQLTEMVPVDRIDSELGRYIQAGATYYLLLNTSDVRPVPMTTRAVMDAAWLGIPKSGSARGKSTAFLERWSAGEFGERAAASVAQVYGDYFSAPAHFGQPPREYGDSIYHTDGRHMMLGYMFDSPLYSLRGQAPRWERPSIFALDYFGGGRKKWIEEKARYQVEQCGGAQPRWDSVWKEALAAKPLVEPSRQDFYQAHVLTMIAINREGNRALLAISNAVLAAGSGNADKARSHAAEVVQALDAIQQAQAAAEYGKWKHWYRGDWLVGVYRTRQVAEVFSKFLSDPFTHLSPPLSWSNWEGYYYIMRHEGTRSVNVSRS